MWVLFSSTISSWKDYPSIDASESLCGRVCFQRSVRLSWQTDSVCTTRRLCAAEHSLTGIDHCPDPW